MPNVVGHGDVAHAALLTEMARRTTYVHLCRWTSLGMALVEAMMLGMPVVATSTTESPTALSGGDAVVTNDPEALKAGVKKFTSDPAWAENVGRRLRDMALKRFGIDRFAHQWLDLLHEVSR